MSEPRGRDAPPPARRPLPTWLKVLAVGLAAILLVGAVALVAAVVPALGDAIRQAPVAIVVLVVGTVLVLGATIRSSLRRR